MSSLIPSLVVSSCGCKCRIFCLSSSCHVSFQTPLCFVGIINVSGGCSPTLCVTATTSFSLFDDCWHLYYLITASTEQINFLERVGIAGSDKVKQLTSKAGKQRTEMVAKVRLEVGPPKSQVVKVTCVYPVRCKVSSLW